MSHLIPYVQVTTNAQGGCCWEVVLAPGLKVQVVSGQEVAKIIHSVTPLRAVR